MAVRCLLICPFAESALNEEAGKLLLESYDDYVKHATMFTQIYAKPKVLYRSHVRSSLDFSSMLQTAAASAAGAADDDAGVSSPQKKSGKVEKAQKEKKRALKRL
jgi:ubiquitin-conjugating enzyme E2 S